MASRRYKRVRMAGQDVPQFNLAQASALCWGRDLFGGVPSGICVRDDFKAGDDDFGELDIDLSRAAWESHRHHVLDYWRRYWEQFDFVPTPWAARIFDGESQMRKPRATPEGHSQIDWARDRIAAIECDVAITLKQLRKAAP